MLKLYLLLVLLPDLAAWFLLVNVMQAVTLWQNSVWVQIGTQDKAVLAKKPQKGIKLNFGTILPPNQGLDDYVQKENFGQTLLISRYMWIT